VVESYCLGVDGNVKNNNVYRREVHPVYESSKI